MNQLPYTTREEQYCGWNMRPSNSLPVNRAHNFIVSLMRRCEDSISTVMCKPFHVRFEVFTAVTMENAVFWDIKTHFIPHMKHIVSAIESSRLMLSKIWGFHDGDYGECRLLGYKNPFHTSHETHHVSAIESSRLMLSKIWGFHDGDYGEFRLLGCYVAWLL
jgi:hypothetical protein